MEILLLINGIQNYGINDFNSQGILFLNTLYYRNG